MARVWPSCCPPYAVCSSSWRRRAGAEGLTLPIRRAAPSLAQLALLLANLVPVFGVLYLDWEVASLVVLYWLENLIVGAYTLLKMLVAGSARDLFLMLFFCVHYGLFWTIHGLFVLELTRFAGAPPAPTGDGAGLPGMFTGLLQRVLASPEVLWGCLALLLSHGISFALLFIGAGEYRRARVQDLMQAPYRRVAVLHVAVIAGAFLVAWLGSPLGLLLALVALKTAMDIMLHNRSHRAAGAPGTSADGT